MRQKTACAVYLSAFCSLSSALPLRAATYYVCDEAAACNARSSGWAAGVDVNDGLSKATAVKTIQAGLDKMTGGDTLIIGDGLYKGPSNMIATAGWTLDIPSGSPGYYTTIRGENYLGAILDGEENTNYVIGIENESYVIFENLHLRNSRSVNFLGYRCDHIKVLRMASEETYYFHFWFRYSKYCLIEDCFAWGRGAYWVHFGGEYGNYAASQYNVVRRFVARRDAHYYAPGGNHFASFVSYWGDNTYFQNCVSVDAQYNYVGTPNPPGITKAVFFTANGSSNYSADGCVSVNDIGMIALFESGASPVALRNLAAWMQGPDNAGVFTYGPQVTVENTTIGNVRGTGEYSGQCIRTNGNPIQSLKNNIILGCERFALLNVNANNSYNVLFNNGENYAYSTPGAGETTNVDPLAQGLRYLPRIEPGSSLTTAGEGGRPVGTTSLKKIGVSGTLYGEPGWDTVTNEDLWPFPNEAQIKERMSAYTAHGINGKRGFCADGNGLYGGSITLTSYIWEYLGNPCPAGICSSSGNPPPPPPGGLILSSIRVYPNPWRADRHGGRGHHL